MNDDFLCRLADAAQERAGLDDVDLRRAAIGKLCAMGPPGLTVTAGNIGPPGSTVVRTCNAGELARLGGVMGDMLGKMRWFNSSTCSSVRRAIIWFLLVCSESLDRPVRRAESLYLKQTGAGTSTIDGRGSKLHPRGGAYPASA